MTAAECLLYVIARLWLHAKYPTARRPVVRCDRTAGQQATAAGADQQHIQRTDFLNQFFGGRALTGDHLRVIIGRDYGQTLFDRQSLSNGGAVFAVALINHHIGAVTARCRQFGRRGVVRHHYGYANP
ncbi:hypothetical protein D3C78_1363640 [compost metagenome]